MNDIVLGAFVGGAALRFAFGLLAGAALGLAHFATLRWSVEALLGRRVALGLLVHVARYAVLALVLVALARAGAATLVGAAVGLMVGRALALRPRGDDA